MSPAFLLSLIVFLPAFGAVCLLGFNRNNPRGMRSFAVTVTGVVFVLTLFPLLPMYFGATPGMHGIRLAVDEPWIGSWNIRYQLGLDGLSLPFLLLTSLLCFLAMLASWSVGKQIKGYLILFLLLETGMLGVFVALDFFLFYVLFEVMLLPMYFLIGFWGGPRKEYAAIKFFLYTLVGSVLMLIALLMVYFASGQGTAAPSFDLLTLATIGQGRADGDYAGLTFSQTFQLTGFALLFAAFAIKLPSVPFHTWLPDAHVEAPTPISMLLAGVLLKVGGYGLLRVAYPLFPHGAQVLSWLVVALGVISILYGALVAMAQTDLKRMVAYSSVSHMGYVLLGLGVWAMGDAGTIGRDHWRLGVNGAVFMMIAHGLISAGMFFVVGVLYDRVHHRNIDEFGHILGRMPIYSGLALGLFFAGLGMPGMAGFIGEIFVLLSSWNFSPTMAVLAALGMILTAAYFLSMIQRVYLGPRYIGPHPEGLSFALTKREGGIAATLLVLSIALGVYPKLALNVTEPALRRFVDNVDAGAEAARKSDVPQRTARNVR
ncbi:MAG: NADH-quinone oxidoreductase subunit M [Planctomycetaceae bacterium]|nr:NADH-quinone oxidoreductase subunit M [Planctomycetaceae bacterium]